MTNVELIKELQKSVDKYGVLPVYIDAGILRDEIRNEEGEDSIRDIVCQMGCVTLYNY